MSTAFSKENYGDYSSYVMNHEFMTDSGLIAVPLAGSVESHVMIRVHGGIGIRLVQWNADRQGKPPIIPSITGNSTITGQDTVLNYQVNVAQQPNPTQTGFNWSASGVYQYVQTYARKPGRDSFPTNWYPFPVDPMTSMVQDALVNQGFAMDDSAPETLDSLGDVDYTTNSFIWPFTHLPKQSSNDNLITTVPSSYTISSLSP